ncbi:hypothetical protein PQR46_35720 [Paraburkholderia sediminicola]|uniref:hypothetical protein n=1 Tax=Paraburkholderia sediminicola TaxID=458836 RepID=UPI0038BC8397
MRRLAAPPYLLTIASTIDNPGPLPSGSFWRRNDGKGAPPLLRAYRLQRAIENCFNNRSVLDIDRLQADVVKRMNPGAALRRAVGNARGTATAAVWISDFMLFLSGYVFGHSVSHAFSAMDFTAFPS